MQVRISSLGSFVDFVKAKFDSYRINRYNLHSMGRRKVESESAVSPLGPYIQGLMADRPHLSGGDIAKMAGISRSYLVRIKKGEVKSPHPDVINGLAYAFSVPADEIALRVVGKLPERATVYQEKIMHEEFALIRQEIVGARRDIIDATLQIEQIRNELAAFSQLSRNGLGESLTPDPSIPAMRASEV